MGSGLRLRRWAYSARGPGVTVAPAPLLDVALIRGELRLNGDAVISGVPARLRRKMDNLIEAIGLQEGVSGKFWTQATASFEVRRKVSGTAVHGPMPLAFVTGTTGDYRARIPASLALTDGEEYVIAVTVTQDGFQFYEELRVVAAAA